MAFIFLFFLFPDFIKADIINSNTFTEINKLDEISIKKLSKSSFLKEICEGFFRSLKIYSSHFPMKYFEDNAFVRKSGDHSI